MPPLDVVARRLVQRLGHRVQLAQSVTRPPHPRIGGGESSTDEHIAGDLPVQLFVVDDGG